MKILFHIFGIPIHFFGLMVALGILIGAFIAYMGAKRKGLNLDKFFDLILYSVISGIIGARIFYISFYNLSFYIENPMEIIKINQGGLSIHGGIATALIFSIFYAKFKKINFFEYADAAAPGIILGQGIGRIGCDVFGKVMNSPISWGIKYQGQLLHPAQVYEFILDYIVFFILWRKRKNINYNGQIFIWYIILFSINRGIVELFRNNPLIIGWLSISHFLSVIFIIGALILMYLIKKGIIKAGHIQYEGKDTIVEGRRRDIFGDILIVLGLIFLSIIIYYSVQS